MMYKEILNKFKNIFPSAMVNDFRPICHKEFTDGKQGITIWLNNGDVIEYYPAEPSKSCCDKAQKNYDVDKCPYQRKNCIMQCLRSEDIKELPKEIINTKSVFNLSEDDISRQAAIDAVHDSYDEILDFKSTGRTVADSVEDIISNLPSADRLTAYWKEDKWCSNCGEGIPTDVWNGGVEKEEIKFCFSCGERMESDEE